MELLISMDLLGTTSLAVLGDFWSYFLSKRVQME
jgi:hypothetical protein